MCFTIIEVRQTEESIWAYKVVREKDGSDGYWSQYHPSTRSPDIGQLDGGDDRGVDVLYTIGQSMTANEGPGFFCYRSLEDAKEWSAPFCGYYSVLEVVIPPQEVKFGTTKIWPFSRAVLSTDPKRAKAVCAQTLIPIRRIDE